jgi:hypothetical protein
MLPAPVVGFAHVQVQMGPPFRVTGLVPQVT